MNKLIFTLVLLLAGWTALPLAAQPNVCQAAYQYTATAGTNTLNFTNYSTGNFTQVFWDFGDGNTATSNNPVHSFQSPGTYSVCLTVSDSSVFCSNTYCQNIAVNAASACSALFSTFDSFGITYFIPSVYNQLWYYQWSFGDGTGSTIISPVHSYNSSGPFLACLTVTDSLQNCTQTFCDTLYQFSQPLPCSASIGSQINPNGGVNFTGYNSGGGTVTNYTWTFGDGTTSNQQYPVHYYAANGNYNVCLVIQGPSCSDTTCTLINVQNTNPCQAQIAWQTGSNGTIYFTGSNAGGFLSSYSWNFGDGGTSTTQSPTHQYTTSGTYTICLTIQGGGCTDSTCIQLSVVIPPVVCSAQFYVDTVPLYLFTPVAYSPTMNYLWNFGDGTTSTDANPTHLLPPGTWIVCLTVSDSTINCNDTWCDTIVVGNCAASFSATTNANGLTQFINNSTGAFTNVTWSFGDGTSSTNFNPSHQYPANGSYITCLTVYNMNNCQSTFCDTVIFGNGGNNCVPLFYAVPDSTVGSGGVGFYLYNTCNGFQYTWSFGDNTSGTGISPYHQYTNGGWYVICVTATSPAATLSYCDSVFVYRLSSGIAEGPNPFNLHLSPNPSTGVVHLDLDLKKTAAIELLSNDGRLVYSVTDLIFGPHSQNFDFSSYPSGLYLLHIRSGDQSALVKFIIRH